MLRLLTLDQNAEKILDTSEMGSHDNKARVIAYYLPQFHPIPENDQWWGKGFTEWTNVGKAKPLFKKHYQPRVPADLGYYDLRMPEVREAQAAMARFSGIEGFMYWHYWFGAGNRLLERPFLEILKSKRPDFPFCLGWANESWMSKTWNSEGTSTDRLLIEQKYYGIEDYTSHFYEVLQAFRDDRYIMENGMPVFLIYQPWQIPNLEEYTGLWNRLARKSGFEKGIYFVARLPAHQMHLDNEILKRGINAVTCERISIREIRQNKIIRNIRRTYRRIARKPLVIRYSAAMKYFTNIEEDSRETTCPSIIPNWDHSPRSGRAAIILHDSTPGLFEEHIKEVLSVVRNKKNKIVFLKSWNEWAEGNYVEPDIKYGTQYLDKLRKILK